MGAVAQSVLRCEDLLLSKPVEHFSAFFQQLERKFLDSVLKYSYHFILNNGIKNLHNFHDNEMSRPRHDVMESRLLLAVSVGVGG